MNAMASQITSLAIVYSTVYSGANQRKHKSSASLAFVRGIHRWPVNSPHKGPVTRKMFSFDDIIMFVRMESQVKLLALEPVKYSWRMRIKSTGIKTHYNTPMWHFGPCVTFRPWQCHFLDLAMCLFGPAAFPFQWQPPPRIRKIYRNRLKIKRDNKNQFQLHK